MIYNIIILPIEIIIDWIFSAIYSLVSQNLIISIAGVSLCVNFLTLPIYNLADQIQEEERKTVNKLAKWVNHIKCTFKSDERFMMLSEYYRQNHYHPIFALRSTFPLLIQIPFFIAAYHYLKTSNLLPGSSFWFINDLGLPDALISFSLLGKPFVLNILPIIMTIINCISGAIYTKNFTIKEKLQIYIVSMIFLVLLYNAPSGLVIYWILNNIFSLVKNLLKKTKKKSVIVFYIFSLILLFISHWFINRHVSYKSIILLGFSYAFVFFIFFIEHSYKKKQFYYTVSLTLSSVFSSIKKDIKQNAYILKYIFKKHISGSFLKNSFFVFLLSCIGLALLCGLVLPSSVIATSPIEFSFLGSTNSPVVYILSSLCLFAGFFIFWPLVLFVLSSKKIKFFFPVLFYSFFICAIFNAYIFKSPYGAIDDSFKLASPELLSVQNPILFILPFMCFIASIMLLLFYRNNFYKSLLLSLCIGELCLGLMNINKIYFSFKDYVNNSEKYVVTDLGTQIKPIYHFSQKGKNVLIIFLDRAIGPFAGEIFEQYPDIKKQFNGFTWYPNTLSFSTNTIQGAPPLYGGYEYTQEKINERKSELLRKKHNESQLIMPLLFHNQGFAVTVTDPALPNYSWRADLCGFDNYPFITVKEVEGAYYKKFLNEKNYVEYKGSDSICRRQIINFSVLQILFPSQRSFFYSVVQGGARKETRQIIKLDNHKTLIMPNAGKWLKPFSNLYYLSDLTDINSDNNSFICIHSMTTHEVWVTVERNDFETVAPEETYNLTDKYFLNNVSAYKQLGKFFDYLREKNIYNNTRIIIVSDHGLENNKWGHLTIKQNPILSERDLINRYSALLLVKDFNANSPMVMDNSFMTNADTLFLAKQNLNISNYNPITNNELIQEKNDGINIYPCSNWNPTKFKNKKTFKINKKDAWHVSKDIFKEDNWIPLLEWEHHSTSGEKNK